MSQLVKLKAKLVKDRTRVLGSADADSKYGSMWIWTVRIQCQTPLMLVFNSKWHLCFTAQTL